jgi:predicted Zn-dependent peptidase
LLQILPAPVLPSAIFTLDNGLTVIHQHLPATPVVVVDVWLRAGATREPEEWSGMAHFLEHMVFKGTPALGPGVFDREIESRGGMTNAATSHDYTHYFLTTAAPYLEETLPYLAELLLNAAIPEDEFVRERDVVLEEIRQAYDNPDWIGFQALSESVYQHHPYGRSVLGTETELMNHSPEAMRCFHRAHYQPENMTVAIVGGIAQKPALELVSQTFQQFSERCNCCPQSKAVEKPLLAGIRRQELCLPRLEQARLLMAWTGPGVEHLRSAYGLDLLSVLLSEGRSSRLVRDLREDRQLVQAIGCSFSLQRESSLFTISALLEPQHVERVESLICAYLDELQTIMVSQGELARCKRFLCNDYAFSTETPNQLAGLYGYYNTIAEAELAVIYPEQIQSFQVEDLQSLAQQYLSPHQYAVTVLKPC